MEDQWETSGKTQMKVWSYILKDFLYRVWCFTVRSFLWFVSTTITLQKWELEEKYPDQRFLAVDFQVLVIYGLFAINCWPLRDEGKSIGSKFMPGQKNNVELRHHWFFPQTWLLHIRVRFPKASGFFRHYGEYLSVSEYMDDQKTDPGKILRSKQAKRHPGLL